MKIVKYVTLINDTFNSYVTDYVNDILHIYVIDYLLLLHKIRKIHFIK